MHDQTHSFTQHMFAMTCTFHHPNLQTVPFPCYMHSFFKDGYNVILCAVIIQIDWPADAFLPILILRHFKSKYCATSKKSESDTVRHLVNHIKKNEPMFH